MEIDTTIWACRAEAKYGFLPDAYQYRSLHPVVAEIVGHRLMRVLDIGASPSIEIFESADARRCDPRQFIFKPVRSDRLKACSPEDADKIGRWTLLVEKIPRAIPLSFLRNHYGVDAGKVEITAPYLIPSSLRVIKDSIWEGKPEILNAAEFFADFVPPEDWSAVKCAIAWNSEAMLRIHAARLFLGMSVAHFSNVLVDPEGRLYSVDHEFCSMTDGEELRILFDNVKPNTRAFEALRGVAELTQEKVIKLFNNLPVPPGARWLSWPMGNKGKTLIYYLDRLDFWKRRFGEIEKSS